MHVSKAFFGLGVVFALGALGCSNATEAPGDARIPEELGEPQADELHADNSTYFVVTRQDFRKCMYPMCGGYFVKRVNRQFTQCADGKWSAECHAVDVDLSAIGLSEAAASDFVSSNFGAGRGLVRGEMAMVKGVKTLVASEAWAGASKQKASGNFWRVTSTGMMCITSPCPSFHEAALNHSFNRNIHEVDLSTAGAGDEATTKGFIELSETGLMIAGWHYLFKGLGGVGIGLEATQFYTRLTASKPVCASTTIDAPYANSPTFYAKNFTSEKEAWGWLEASFPYGQNKQVVEGACNEPTFCIQVYQPVCGTVKDYGSKTYGNSCQFQGAVLADAGDSGESKGFYTKGECQKSCDLSDPTKNYIGKSPAECMLIKYFCAEGVPFSDACGCGCQL